MIGRRTPPPPDTAGDDESGLQSFDDFEVRLGDVMRGERATLGKSLLDVQRELKIKASYIAAIENADPSAFETPGFVAGYVRSYARYLRLDPDWAFAQFCIEGNFEVTHTFAPDGRLGRSKSKRPDGAVRGTVSRDPFENPNTPFAPRGESVFSRIEPGALGSVTVLVALICGIGYGGWSVLQQVQQVQLTPVDQTPGVVAELDPLSPTGLSSTVETAGLTPPPVDSFDRLYRPQALEVPVLTARDGPISNLDPSRTGTLAGVARTPATTVATATVPDDRSVPGAPPVKVVEDGPQQVVMFAVRPSWVRVSGADGTVLFEKILDAGETYVLPQTEEPPLLRAGNAGDVYFQVAGETYGPAGSGGAVVRNIALGPDELRGAFSVADLGANRELARVVATLDPLTPVD